MKEGAQEHMNHYIRELENFFSIFEISRLPLRERVYYISLFFFLELLSSPGPPEAYSDNGPLHYASRQR